jgi:hypothetical protein
MRWTDERRDTLVRLWPEASVATIAKELRSSRGAIYRKADELGLPERAKTPPRPSQAKVPHGGPLHRRVAARGGRAATVLAPDHPAAVKGQAFFRHNVVHAGDSPRVLIAGHNQRKIGARVVKGRWKGKPIYTTTLEERATCPRRCAQWLRCYGNNMHWSRRHVLDDALIEKLKAEIAAKVRQHPQGFVVRPHILGDFGSPDDRALALRYIDAWAYCLDAHPELHLFGYTAHDPRGAIGEAILDLVLSYPDRCWIRFSGHDAGQYGAIVIEDPSQSRGGVVCPVQTGKTDCCGTCGLCWTAQRTIEFIRH